MKQMYIVIRCSENGDVTVEQYNKKDLTELINDQEEENFDTHNFMKKITDKDPQYWGPDNILIIKGEIIVPKPVKVIEQYQVE